jgi:hypothetical protein
MFAFVATALAGTVAIGWPCQRLNWGWRTVWTTCSINSFVPAATPDSGLTQAPTHYRYSSDSNLAPVRVLNTAGVFTPSATAAIPGLLCTNAMATGSGTTANLRNRCRRAIDAYGALVRTCGLPAGVAGVIRGPNTLGPDYAPTSGHQPHVLNVQGLGQNAQMCLLPAGVQTPANIGTPSTTCPGLLGWFTVVFNACGFTNAPGLSVAQQPNTPYTAQYFPIGSTATASVLNGAAVSPTNRAGYFCATGGGNIPSSWNDASGTNFRTSRCRKALDQFGRTASRCHLSTLTGTGPSQAGGYSDPLRLLAVGAAPATPTGINVWAPACNA